MSSYDEGIGSVIYPGIQKIESADYTRSHGIVADVCTISMCPQPLNPSDPGYTPIEPEGYLIFQFDEYKGGGLSGRTQIVMQGCRADLAAVQRSENSETWSIPIYDRRWRWKYGSYSGHWNIKKNGRVESRKERTVRQLADMCLEAMGEQRYDTSALDDLEYQSRLPYRGKVRPEVHWDRIPPAEALDELVTSLGYRVCLGWDDRVRICKYGVGSLLPISDDLMSGSFETDLPEIPKSISVVGNISMHETVWELEAVGLDIDGVWKPIDHLSYKPRSEYGWHMTRPPDFLGLEEPYEAIIKNTSVDKTKRERLKEQLKLARQTVFRCYRLKYPFGTKENKSLRDKYDNLGRKVARGLNQGLLRENNKAFDALVTKYEDAARELFRKSEPILPGPLQRNPRTGKLGPYKLEELEQVLPCFETRAELWIDPFTGKLERKAAVIHGAYYSERKQSNTYISEFVQRDTYDISPDLGIIQFKEPMTRMGQYFVDNPGGGKRLVKYRPFAAELYLLIAVPLKSPNGEIARYVYEYEIPKKYRNKVVSPPSGLSGSGRSVNLNVGTKVVRDDQITLAYQAKFEFKKIDSNNEVKLIQKEVLTNVEAEELDKLALARVDTEMERLALEDGGSGKYGCLKKVNLDGAIQQIAISRDTNGGMTTTLSRLREVDTTVPDFDERQRTQALKEMITTHNQTVDKTEKVKPKG